MTAPRISAVMVLTEIGDGRLRAETALGERVVVDATREQERAFAEYLYVSEAIRVTVEPADAPAHGSPLDYLAELKGLLVWLLEDQEREENEPVVRRCLSLANSAHLAILAERARR